jgi:hypothetical protein
MSLFKRLSNWWNQIGYIKIVSFNTYNIIKIPRKYVSIGYETEDNKTVTLKDINDLKRDYFNISEIYPRLVLTHPEKWTVYIPKIGKYEDLGWFESRSIKVGSNFNRGFFLGFLNHQDVNFITCFGKWYRGILTFWRTKPYIIPTRSRKVMVVPWEDEELKDYGCVNKQQAVAFKDVNGVGVFEIRWTKDAIKVFDENKDKYTTYEDLIIKKKKKSNKKKK